MPEIKSARSQVVSLCLASSPMMVVVYLIVVVYQPGFDLLLQLEHF